MRMIRTYIYHEDKNNWLEEDYLLLHDLCAFLDEEDNIIYLWNGPKSSQKRLEKGYESVVDLITNMPVENPIQLTILTEDIPPKIQKKLDELLSKVKKEEEEESNRFTTLLTIRLFFIFSLIGLILPIISFFNILSAFDWNSSEGIAQIQSDQYDVWLNISRVLILIVMFAYIGNLIIGIYEQDVQIIVFSITAIIICIGILIYFIQGIFLFDFEDNSTSDLYYISHSQLLTFSLINLFSIIILLLPNLYKFILFLKSYSIYIF